MTQTAMDCDIINAADGTKVCSVRLSVMPQIGDGLDLDTGSHGSGTGLFRVVEVHHHIRPRKLAGVRWAFRTDDLVGVSLYVTSAAATLPRA